MITHTNSAPDHASNISGRSDFRPGSKPTRPKWASSAIHFACFLVMGLIVFVGFSHIRPVFDKKADLVGRACLLAALLISIALLRKNSNLQKYRSVLYAFFIAALATSIDYYLPSSKWLLAILKLPMQTPAGLALDKLDSSVIIIGIILLFTKIAGSDLDSLYLKKGNVRQGLTIGVIAFLVCVAGSAFIAQLYGAQNLSLARVVPWIPWILIFIAGNAFNEELLFRGLFLKKFGDFVGRFLSNLAISIPFVLHHTGVTYTNSALLFLAYLLPLAFVWGAITQKTDSLWGSVLFHAGTDIPVVLVIFSQLP